MNKPLTEVCNITTGKLDANAATINGAYPFFTCAPDPLRIDNYAFDDDAILLAGNNAQGNFHINRYCGKFNAYQRTYVITAKDGYDIDYIKYSIELSLEHLKKVSQGSQTKFLTMQILNSFKVSDIPYTSQQKLIKSIKKIDQKIELNNRIIAELEAMSKTIYDYWFVQFDFPNVEGKPYRSAGGEMVWNEQLKREIPKGWEAKSVISTFDVCYGYPFDTNQFVDFPNEKPVVRIRDILNCDVSAYTTESVDVKYWLQEKDLVIGMDGNFHMNFWSSTPALLNQRCVRIRGNEEYSALQAYFASLPYIKAREKNVTRTTVGHLSADDINSLYILTPDLPLQKKITEMFDSFLEKMCKTKKENIELAKLRDWLLPMLMNGQVTVE
jgi:type I restriction enzyme S subunit